MPLAQQYDMVEYPVCWHSGAPEQRMLSFGNRVFDDMDDYWIAGCAYEHTYAWNKIYRRELFADVRFPMGKVFEDVATLPLLLARTKRVATCDKGLYHYTANPEGITAKASGTELAMLLESHLPIVGRLKDDRYYMHVLNIQLDVYELSGRKPLLPKRQVSALSGRLTLPQRLKAVSLNLLGINGLCKLNKFVHQTMRLLHS